MGPKHGGKSDFWTFFELFLGSEPCSDPLCCWNAPGPRFFTILASLFLHFCVAARYKEQLFNKKTNKGGSRQELKITSKRTRKMRPILGGSSDEALSFCSSFGSSPPTQGGGKFLLGGELLGSTFLLQLTRTSPPKPGG